MGGKTSVAVFFGGQSSEHAISCLTAAGVMRALDPTRFEAYGIGIDTQGGWHRYQPAEIAAMKVENGQFPKVDSNAPLAVLFRDEAGVQLATIEGQLLHDCVGIDVALPLLHGPFGEDGTIQGLFEMLGLRYVGSGVAASAIGMDKQYMKEVFSCAGLDILPYLVLHPGRTLDSVAAELAELSYPLYVKPARGGSSMGISKVDSADQLPAALEVARRHDPKVLIEQGVDAREIECAVLGGIDGGAPRLSGLGEIVVREDFYDFEAKYVADDEAALLVAKETDPDLIKKVHDVARRAFQAVGAEGLARVDSFVLPDGRVLINEINTMPGFTSISMFPSLWQAAGLSYSELITDLLTQALSRPLGMR